jgi:hypothetical protein
MESKKGSERAREMSVKLTGPTNPDKEAILRDLFTLVEAAFDAWAIEKIQSADHVTFRFSFPRGNELSTQPPADRRLMSAYALAAGAAV